MALTKCPDCGGDMSGYAAECPHCGYADTPLSKRERIARYFNVSKILTIAGIAVGVLGILSAVINYAQLVEAANLAARTIRDSEYFSSAVSTAAAAPSIWSALIPSITSAVTSGLVLVGLGQLLSAAAERA